MSGMKKQVYNPFLPMDICIADGEVHVFGDRVYLFGSHDKEERPFAWRTTSFFPHR